MIGSFGIILKLNLLTLEKVSLRLIGIKDLNVNNQLENLTNFILNVFSNFVPNKTITIAIHLS